MRRKALIVSIKGITLSKREINLFSKEKPWGVILFKRNLKSVNQIVKLTKKIKILTKNRNFPIIIDEEGGSVTRLTNLIRNDISANFFGSLFKKNQNICLKILKHYIYSVSKVLNNLGININSIPVLDVLRHNTNKIIGDRSFSKNQKIVKILGDFTIKYLHENKIVGIIKHIPGHGAATLDSHKKMPKVYLSKKKLNKIDFYPFKSSKAKLAMTAHILYSNYDKNHLATFSKKIIKE